MIKGIIIHHTADSRTGNQFERVNEYHRTKFGLRSLLGYFVAYQYLIEKSGEVRKAREDWEEGTHTRGYNLNYVAICLAGNFDIEQPTERQWEALNALLAEKCDEYELTAIDLLLHRDVGLTACPGQFITKAVIIKQLAKRAETFIQRLKLWSNLLFIS